MDSDTSKRSEEAIEELEELGETMEEDARISSSSDSLSGVAPGSEGDEIGAGCRAKPLPE
jgi:hypothetical protein